MVLPPKEASKRAWLGVCMTEAICVIFDQIFKLVWEMLYATEWYSEAGRGKRWIDNSDAKSKQRSASSRVQSPSSSLVG